MNHPSTLRHSTFGLDRVHVRPPDSLATIVHAAAPEHPRDRVRQSILDLLATVPRPGTAAADLTEAERMALVVAAGAPYDTVMEGNMLRLRTTVPVGVADRPGGGYFVAIGAAERPGDTVTVRLP
jgi:hypothetical protein